MSGPQQNPRQNKARQGRNAPPAAAGKGAKATGWIISILVTGGILAAILGGAGVFDSDDNDTTVAPPTAQETTELVERLAEAEKAHGICYGWELRRDIYSTRGEDMVSSGSSRGVNVPADTCDDWVVLKIGVRYTDAESELEDSAEVDVERSASLSDAGIYSSDLERMGITREAAINDPAATAGLGALALPLLMVEQGVAEPLPLTPATGTDTATTPPIAHPGSDFLSTNAGALIALGIIGGLALLSLIVGLIVRAKRGEEAR